MKQLGVVVVDPLPVVRAGMAMLIDDRSEMTVLAEAGTADEAIGAIERVGRSEVVVLVGTGLEGDHDAFWLIREIRSRFPTLAILGCGAKADATSISRALFVGADGFVDKNVDPDAFLLSIHHAASGELVLSGTSGALVGDIADGIERRLRIESKLTEREREVLTVAAEGLTARQMAERLGVRERTITTHLARIYGKLGVGSRVGALRIAATSGMVSIVGLD
jgi:DNA-binding NarL/FixJ family response regulator